MICNECQSEREKGYSRSPFTGEEVNDGWWCDACFERISARHPVNSPFEEESPGAIDDLDYLMEMFDE